MKCVLITDIIKPLVCFRFVAGSSCQHSGTSRYGPLLSYRQQLSIVDIEELTMGVLFMDKLPMPQDCVL